MAVEAWETSLEQLAARLATQGARSRTLAIGSQQVYLGDCRRLGAWLASNGVPGPEAVTASSLQAALRALGWSPATRRRALTAVREWLGPLHPPGRSPADLVAPPKVVQPPIPRLSQTDAAALVDRSAARARATAPRSMQQALALRDLAMVELLYGSGLRRAEVVGLVLPSLDFEAETVRLVGKGGKLRTVPLTEPSVDALRDWLVQGRPLLAGVGPVTPRSRAHVFLSRNGRGLDGSTLYRVVARHLREGGRAGGPHLLRHAAATHLLEGPDGVGGAHLRVVQEVLGHASLATTQRYTGVTTKALQRALRDGHPRGEPQRG